MADEYSTPIELLDQLGDLHDPVPIFTGPVEIHRDGKVEMVGVIEIELCWLPATEATFRLSSSKLSGPLGGTVEIRGIPGVLSLTALTTGMSFGTQPVISGVITGSSYSRCELVEMRFGITNAKRFLGSPITQRTADPDGSSIKSTWAGRLEVSNRDWKLTVDERREAGELIRSIKATGGISVTHTASLTRVDGQSFDETKANEMIDAIRGFLAIVRGAWAAPVLAVGIDVGGETVWRDWAPPTSDRWVRAESALDVHHPEEYQSVFEGYLDRWQDSIWNEPLRYATHMYVEANSGITLDTTLFLSQTILELIAWVLFVEDQQTKVAEDFDGARASDRIRELLAWMDVDSRIPTHFAELSQSCNALGWVDGPHALTSMRNALAHPKSRERLSKPSIAARVELHQLALWYVELALLRLIGFDGRYSNRLTARNVGEVEPVPWSAAADDSAEAGSTDARE